MAFFKYRSRPAFSFSTCYPYYSKRNGDDFDLTSQRRDLSLYRSQLRRWDFPFNAFYAKNGNWSIGTDSHIGLNHLEELRWLDYGQRLIHHQRTSFIHQGQPDGAQNALISSWKGGRNAMGLSSAHFLK
jgi:hypothetical protein